MRIEVAHFADDGSQESAGLYDYSDEGDTYTFSDGDERVTVRIYVDNPNQPRRMSRRGRDQRPVTPGAARLRWGQT
jgi:hypothetical protein